MEKTKYLARLDEFREAYEEFKEVAGMKTAVHKEVIGRLQLQTDSHHAEFQMDGPSHYLQTDFGQETERVESKVKKHLREGTCLEDIDALVSKNDQIVKAICCQPPYYDYAIKDSDPLGFLLEKPKKKYESTCRGGSPPATSKKDDTNSIRAAESSSFDRTGGFSGKTLNRVIVRRRPVEPKYFGPEHMLKTRPKFETGKKLFRTSHEVQKLDRHSSQDPNEMRKTFAFTTQSTIQKLKTSVSVDYKISKELFLSQPASSRTSRKQSLTLDQFTSVTCGETTNPYDKVSGLDPLLQTGVSFDSSEAKSVVKQAIRRGTQLTGFKLTSRAPMFGLEPHQIPKCITLGVPPSPRRQEWSAQQQPPIRLLVRQYHNKHLRQKLLSISHNN